MMMIVMPFIDSQIKKGKKILALSVPSTCNLELALLPLPQRETRFSVKVIEILGFHYIKTRFIQATQQADNLAMLNRLALGAQETATPMVRTERCHPIIWINL